jgi:hypothetical protein
MASESGFRLLIEVFFQVLDVNSAANIHVEQIRLFLNVRDPLALFGLFEPLLQALDSAL